jgi:hypothetical protein
MKSRDVVNETKELCAKMRQDLHFFKQLSEQYSKALLLIHYEDFILDFNSTLYKMYGHLNEEPPLEVINKLNSMMHAGDVKNAAYSQQRSNASASVYNWMKKHSEEQVVAMTNNCKDVLLTLDYPLDVSSYVS